MDNRDRDLATWWKLAKVAAPGLFLLFLTLGGAALLFDFGLRAGGLWPGERGAALHRACLWLAAVAHWGVVASLWPALAVALFTWGRHPKWMTWGWLVMLVTPALFFLPGWLGYSDDLRTVFAIPGEYPGYPETPFVWLRHRLLSVLGEGCNWLILAGAVAALHWIGCRLFVALRRWGRRRGMHGGSPQPVRRRGTIVVIALAAALGAAALGSTCITVVMRGFDEAAFPVGVCTAILSALLVVACIRFPATPGSATLACLFGAVAGALVNSPLSFIVLGFVSEPRLYDTFLSMASFAGSYGMLIAAPLGAVIGALLIVPTRLGHRLSRSDASDAFDRALRGVGAWSLVVGVACLFAMTHFSRCLTCSGAISSFREVAVLSTLVLGACGFALGTARIRWRRRWLARVASGAVEDWAIVRLDADEQPPAGLGPFLVTNGFPDALLVRRTPARDAGAYRTGGDLDEPRAWLCLETAPPGWGMQFCSPNGGSLRFCDLASADDAGASV